MLKKTLNALCDFGLTLIVGMLPHSGTPRWFGLAVLGLVSVAVVVVLYFSVIPLLLPVL